MDAERWFAEREDDGAQAAAIDAVCARLGRAREWVADDGYEHAIVGGAIDGERTAWVERRSRSDGGWEDVAYHLRMQVDGAMVREWIVDTYNPYFGCDVGYLRWWGESVVAIYREKHHTIVCALGPVGAPRLQAIDDAWRVSGEVVLHASEARGLIERLCLPDLQSGAPMAGADAMRPREVWRPGPPLAASFVALLRPIAARLPALPEPVAELLIGALAYRFWDAWPTPVGRYDDAYSSRRWNPPCWLPFYVYCESSGAEARALLDCIEAVAARRAMDYSAEDEAAELACRHVAARCGELAAACRAGRLPEGTSCYFWSEWSQAAFAGWEALFPPGMWAAWQALRPRARELYALGTLD